MRRKRYRMILIALAILIVLIGMMCIYELNTPNQIIEGTFVYGR